MRQVAACLALSTAAAALAAPASAQTLKMVAHSDLKVLDPIWTTAFITRNHGYMIYDTLFALDAEARIQPQMVDKYEVSADKLTWTFTLRDGLEWHDGQPVTAEDCVASIKRWGARDSLGQQMMASVGTMKATDAKTFQIVLKEPFGRDRPVQADRRLYRLRPVHLQEGRMEARREGRLCQEYQVQAARRAALDAGRRQGGEDRPPRMARDRRPVDGGQRPCPG
jgi:ABC-type transport system substrate-binding protein